MLFAPLVIIDECVSSRFGKWLRSQGLENVLCVSECKCLRGMDDESLQLFGEGINALLVTQDSLFFDYYSGPKIYYHPKRWKAMSKEIKEYYLKF